MIKRTKVASAINLAIVASITSGAFVTSSAFAAEEKPKLNVLKSRVHAFSAKIWKQLHL